VGSIQYAQLRGTLKGMTPEDWRKTVGETIEERRRSLYRSRRAAATAAGVNEAIFRQLESGERQNAPDSKVAPNPLPATRAAVCRALAWTPDSIDRLIQGGEPTLAFDRSDVTSGGKAITGLTEAEWEVLAATLAAIRKAGT